MNDNAVNTPIDLNQLLVRESEQVEWKENVADPDDVIATLSAFANDASNLGGGYVICGAKEVRDAHGFPAVEVKGLTASRLKEIEGKVLTGCRDRVSPALAPLVNEIPTHDPAHRVLVFIMAASPKAHTFRKGTESGKHYVRISRETREARNGILRELLLRKNEIEPWDRRLCTSATTNDLDLVALRDALQRMNVFDPRRGIDDYLSESHSLSPFVPPLCRRDPLTGQLRPRNYAMLLFGRQVQAHVQGAYSLVSIYPGQDRSEPRGERHELDGTIIEQARRCIDLLGAHNHIAFDKTNQRSPNLVKYPRQALIEAVVNALAHRDYELYDPARTTVFSDRIEIVSPGALPVGVKLDTLRAGQATPIWRNQSLAWFLSRLQLAQAEGQGIPTIFRSMREEGCPAPVFDADDARVTCTLLAHPLHRLASITYDGAQVKVQALLTEDPKAVHSFTIIAELLHSQKDSAMVRTLLSMLGNNVFDLPPGTLIQLAEVLTLEDTAPRTDLDTAGRLFAHAALAPVDENEARTLARGLGRTGDDHAAVAFVDKQLNEHPEWMDDPQLLQARGTAYLGIATQRMALTQRDDLPPPSRKRALDDVKRFIELARNDLERALDTADALLLQTVKTKLALAEALRKATGRKPAGTRPGRR